MQMNQVVALLLGGLACGFDWKSRRIPNLLTFGGAAVAFVYAFATRGPEGLFVSLQGWALGLALFLPMYLLGGMGAGDVKLLGCLGAWFGPQDAFWMAMSYWRVMGMRPLPELTLANANAPRLPYAIPIAAGAVAAVLIR
jgi:prepilin peptidase CpaA